MVFAIASLHNRLRKAIQPVVLEIESAGGFQGGPGIRPAAEMARQCQRIHDDALAKAGGVMISANGGIYVEIAQTAAEFAEAGRLLAGSANGDGTYDGARYSHAVQRLQRAMALFG